MRQLKDFWNDLEHVSKLGDKFHYMHSLTLRRLENEFESSAFEIIDGQQRLATSLILLGLLAKITQHKDPKYDSMNLEPVLSYKYYGLSEAFGAIMGEEKDLEKFKTSFYAKNLIDAYAFFKEKISDTPMEMLEKMFDVLTKKMLFSVAELNDNRIDPFSSFETINNRGKDLSTLELLKNRIDELLFYLSYSSKVWNFLHTLDEKAITLIFNDNKKLEIEITPKTRTLLDKMRRLNALSDNAFLPLLLSLFTIQLEGKHANKQPYTTKELEGLLEYLERFGFLIYGVAGRDTAKNEWIGLDWLLERSKRIEKERGISPLKISQR